MKKTLLIVCLVLIATAFVVPESKAGIMYLSQDEQEAAVSAIRANDVDSLNRIIKGKKLSDQAELIDAAFESGCRTDIVQLLIQKGLKPGELPRKKSFGESLMNNSAASYSGKYGNKNLTAAVSNSCLDVVNMIMPMMTPNDIAAASMNYKLAIIEQRANDAATASRHAEIFKVLVSENKKYCKEGDSSNVNCRALAHLKNEFAGMESREQHRQYKESPEGILTAACETNSDIRYEQGIIDDENAIGRTSGVVNKRVLHEAGGRIVELKKELSMLKEEYRKKTGKTLSLGACPKK